MNIYLAGSCASEHRTMMRKIAGLLRNEPSFNVYCPWELKIENAWQMSQENWSQEVFTRDCKAIEDCDIMIVISYGRESSTESTGWEQGYGYALGKKIFVLQVTDKSTCLMTYCGCFNFYNINGSENELRDAIRFIVQNWNQSHIYKSACRTILT